MHTHTHTQRERARTREEYCAAIKKDEIVAIGKTWMNLQGVMLSEESQAEKDKYHMIPITDGI